MDRIMKTKEYPKVDHDEVRCPSCHRSLADVKERHYPFSEAPFAKHCGEPCYGTAWYSFEPRPKNVWAAGFGTPYTSAADKLDQGNVHSVNLGPTQTYDWSMSIPITQKSLGVAQEYLDRLLNPTSIFDPRPMPRNKGATIRFRRCVPFQKVGEPPSK